MARLSAANSRMIAPGCAFYTYMHTRASDGKVFYVGKGCKNRAWSTDGRSAHWRRVKEKHGVLVTICASWTTEQEAFEHERLLVSVFSEMGHPLTNATSGGEGVSGHKRTPEQLAAMSAAGRARYKTPAGQDALKRMAAANSARLADPAVRAATVEGLRGWQAAPENRPAVLAIMAQARAAAWSEENKPARVAAMREAERLTGASRARAVLAMQDPARREALMSAMRAHWDAEGSRVAVSERMRAYYANEENRRAVGERSRQRMADPAAREALSKKFGGKPIVHIQTGTIYATQGDAVRALGISQPNLCTHLKGGRGSVKGHTFKFIDDAN